MDAVVSDLLAISGRSGAAPLGRAIDDLVDPSKR